jgi:hypothetical protein
VNASPHIRKTGTADKADNGVSAIHPLKGFPEYHTYPELPIASFAYQVVIVHFCGDRLKTQDLSLSLLV